MTRAGIISVDGHVKAPRAKYRDYIDPGFRDQFDEWLLVGNPHVTETDARKILYGNAAEVYAFDLAALQPTFDEFGFELDDLVPADA